MTRTLLHAALAAGFTLVAAQLLSASDGADDPRDLIAKAKVGIRDAISTATSARPGAAVSAGLESDEIEGEDHVVWEIVVAGADGVLYEIVIDAANGKVLEEEECDGEDARAELAAARRVLRHTELSLAQLVERAAGIVHGRAAAAAYELGDAGPECEILVVNGRYLIEVDLEARAGHLLDLGYENELRRGRDDEGEDGEADEEHEEGEEHGDREGGAWKAPSPLADGTAFSAQIDHPFLPLSTVRYAVLGSGTEKVIREVQPDTREVAGVACLVLAEKEFENGELAEISYNFFAQDREGNVWYFGEDVDDYEDGEVVGHGGAWLVGRNAEEPCLFMPAQPRQGMRFKRENSPPDAEEFDEVAGQIEGMKVPAGSYEDVLVVLESDQGFGRWKERKYYARGIGLISENGELDLASLRPTDR